MRIRTMICLLLAFLLIPAAFADRVVDYDDIEYYNLSSGFTRVYTKNGETVRIVRHEFVYYYEVDRSAEVASVYWLGDTDCVGSLYIDRLSYSGFHVTQVGDDIDSCLGYSAGMVNSVYIVSGHCKRVADYAFQACDSDAGYQNGLTTAILPWNLESIGKKAFDGQTHLSRIYIPKAVTSMGADCIPAQTTIVCHKNSTAAQWARANGRKCEYIEDGFKSGQGVFKLPEGLTSLADDAFEGVPVKYIILPHSFLYLPDMDPDIIYFFDTSDEYLISTYTRNNHVNYALLKDVD